MKDEPATANKIAVQRLTEVAARLKDEGVDVILRPETMGKSAMLGTLEETIAWSRAIEGVLPASTSRIACVATAFNSSGV
jgi:deoxyribonuclease-4